MRNVLSRVRAGIARATRRVTRRAASASGGRTSGS
jgi:hypothetical protein